MPKGKSNKVVFKHYDQHQTLLFPPSLDSLLASDHSARVVSAIIDQVNIEPLLSAYQGGGASVYHPKLLLKVLVYGYMNNIYSSRKLERAVKEQIPFMWLAGMSKPDHHTINRFRGKRLSEGFRKVFDEVVLLLIKEGYLSLKQSYTDGTKIEANANKYSFVWAKSIETNTEKIRKQLQELWAYAQSVSEKEEDEPLDLEQIDSKKVLETVEKIDAALAGKTVEKKVKQKLTYARKNWPNKVDEYAEKKKILNGRGSYSKTDPDATFMRLKDDHMRNKSLKAAYNWQCTSSGQFVLGYSIHQNPSDTPTYKVHLQEIQAGLGSLPESNCADAAYGSEENYAYLEEQQVKAYVKYNRFHKDIKGKWKDNPFDVRNLHYNQERDCYYCPMGQAVNFVGIKEGKTKNGHPYKVHRYQAQNCSECPLRAVCHKSKKNRVIEVNYQLNAYRKEARKLLTSEKGIKQRGNRAQDIEGVFGQIKQNAQFRRFMLRGKEKVTTEIGLVCLAHNINKKINAQKAKDAA